MKFTASCAELSGLKADSLILPTGPTLENSVETINQWSNNAISSTIESGEFTGKSGQVVVLNFPELSIQRIILLGTDGLSNQRQVKKAVTAACGALNKTKSQSALWIGGNITQDIQAEASIVAQSIIPRFTTINNKKKVKYLRLSLSLFGPPKIQTPVQLKTVFPMVLPLAMV